MVQPSQIAEQAIRIADFEIGPVQKYVHHHLEHVFDQDVEIGIVFTGRDKGDIYIGKGGQFAAAIAARGDNRKRRCALRQDRRAGWQDQTGGAGRRPPKQYCGPAVPSLYCPEERSALLIRAVPIFQISGNSRRAYPGEASSGAKSGQVCSRGRSEDILSLSVAKALAPGTGCEVQTAFGDHELMRGGRVRGAAILQDFQQADAPSIARVFQSAVFKLDQTCLPDTLPA